MTIEEIGQHFETPPGQDEGIVSNDETETTGNYRIEQTDIIEDSKTKQLLADMNEEIFAELKLKSPIAQTYKREVFLEFMENPEVQKYLLKTAEQETVGFGLSTQNIALEPLLSPEYFQNKYPDRPVYLIMSMAISEKHRKPSNASMLLREMLAKCPENVVGIFLYSQENNRSIPVLAKRSIPRKIKFEVVDAEYCGVCEWEDSGSTDIKQPIE